MVALVAGYSLWSGGRDALTFLVRVHLKRFFFFPHTFKSQAAVERSKYNGFNLTRGLIGFSSVQFKMVVQLSSVQDGLVLAQFSSRRWFSSVQFKMVLFSLVQFKMVVQLSSVRDGIYALGKSHKRFCHASSQQFPRCCHL